MAVRRLKEIWPWLGLALVAAWPLLIINKGFDLTDTGFYLTGYRYAFSHPEFNSVINFLSTWLGGLIYHLPPSGQMLAIKAAAVVMYAAIAYWSFAILREHFPDWLVIISLALASIYATTFFYSASYNTFSYFFLSAAIFLLYRGLQHDRPRYLFAAAVLLGFNVFNRLPNLLQWALAAVPFWYYWVCLGRRRTALKLTFYFTLIMAFSSLLLLCFYIYVIGPDNTHIQFGSLLGTAKGDDHGNHSALAMWDRYVLDDLAIGSELLVRYGLGLVGGALALLAVVLAFPRSRVMAVTAAVGALALGWAAGLSAYFGPQLYPEETSKLAPGFYALAGLLIGLAGLLYYHQKNPLLSALSAMTIIVFLAMAFGSDFGVTHYLYYVHFSVTVCLGLVYRLWLAAAEWIKNRRSGPVDIPAGILIALNLPLWFMLGLGFQQLKDPNLKQAAMDAPYYLTTAGVEGAPVLAGMRTNPLRAKRLSRLTRELRPFQDMEIVVLGQCPLCLTLTDSKPFMNYLWPDLRGLTGFEFERLLYEGLEQGRPPLILLGLEKRDPWRLDWRDQHKDRLLKKFLEKNGYVLHYDGGLFQIYLPPGRTVHRGA